MGKPRIAPMREATLRQRIHIAGKIRSLRGKTDKNAANLECEVTDGTGSLLLVFQGRRRIPGIAVGALLVAEGMVGSWSRRLAILNPDYELVAD
jgi:RecG-like helicase